MSVITYKNVTAPNFAAGNLLRTSSLQGITEGFDAVSDALSSMHERKSDQITGQAIGDIMNLTDPRTMAQERQDIMARLDPRYADMAGIAAAGNQQQAHLLDMAQEQFKVDTQQELYNLTRQGKLASIGASNRSGRGGGGGGGTGSAAGLFGNTSADYVKGEMLAAVARNDPAYQKLDTQGKQQYLLDLGIEHRMSSKVMSSVAKNTLGFTAGFDKEARGRAAKKKAYTPKRVEPPEDLDSPWASFKNDADSKDDWRKKDERAIKANIPFAERKDMLNSSKDFFTGNFDNTDWDMINKLNRFETASRAGVVDPNDPVSVRIEAERKLRNGG